MAFDKDKIARSLAEGFATIETKASKDNPATMIVARTIAARTIAAAIAEALADTEVSGEGKIEGDKVTFTGTLQ